jgi:hypothetical protein
MTKQTVNQPTAAPTRKGIAAAVGGMLSTVTLGIITAIAEGYPSLSFLSDPLFVGGVTTLCGAAGFYVTKEWKTTS